VTRLFCAFFVVSLIVAAGAAVAPRAPAQSPANAFDRTYRCSMVDGGGFHQMNVWAQTGVRQPDNRSQWFALPHVSLSAHVDDSLTGIQAGAPKSPSGSPQPTATLWINTKQCRLASARVAFSRTGLVGGAASMLQERHECPAPRQVFLRVRAVFRSRPSLRLDRDTGVQGTSTVVKSAYLAVRNQKGKPLVYGEVFQTGTTRLFRPRTCG
jgi:hypothetical protein